MSKETSRITMRLFPIVVVLVAILVSAAALENNENICVEGYVMDNYCINLGYLLDNRKLQPLVHPDRHSVHCLVDVGVCRNQGYVILNDPAPGENRYTKGYALNNARNQKLIALARKVGRKGDCTTCTSGEGNLEQGMRAGIQARVVDAIADPPIIEVLSADYVNRNEVFCPLIDVQPEPTRSPSLPPTLSPTISPTVSPTNVPTFTPTSGPTALPTTSSTVLSPTNIPTFTPTSGPTALPTTSSTVLSPTNIPTFTPTSGPTALPTTSFPTVSPTNVPYTAVPSSLSKPTLSPTGTTSSATPSSLPNPSPNAILSSTTLPSVSPSTLAVDPTFEPTRSAGGGTTDPTLDTPKPSGASLPPVGSVAPTPLSTENATYTTTVPTDNATLDTTTPTYLSMPENVTDPPTETPRSHAPSSNPPEEVFDLTSSARVHGAFLHKSFMALFVGYLVWTVVV